jgi:hypothetical protein
MPGCEIEHLSIDEDLAEKNCIVGERDRPAPLPQKCILVAQALAANIPKDGA